MERKLGIYVTSDQHFEKLLRLCQAAERRHIAVSIFLTHIGTKLSRNPRFGELAALAKVALCTVAFEDNGLTKPVDGLDPKGFSSQVWHAEMLNDCDRYLTF
jgi:arylamine N-acetyltransferase